MILNTPSTDEWRPLYAAMDRLKTLAPWEWMEETDLFGVQDPVTGEQGFVSVMGMAGQHFSVSVYRGARALYQFWDFHDDPLSFQPQALLQIPQLMASFEDREFMEKEDRAVIKQLGLKYRGANAWPQFRAFRPGYFPWFVEADEARFLTLVLEQVLDVAPRFKENDDLLDPFNDDRYLIRIAGKEGDQFVWHDNIVRVTAPAPIMIIGAPIDDTSLTQLKKLPLSQQKLEVDCLILPKPIQEKRDTPPIMPYVYLVVDSRTGMVLASDILQADPTLESMYAQIPQKLMTVLAQMPRRVKEIHVSSALMRDLLQPLGKDAGFPVRLRDELPALDSAIDEMFSMMGIPSNFPPMIFDDNVFFDPR